MIQFEISQYINSMITVIGVGGGGNNAVNYLYNKKLSGVNFLVCNTDLQVLEKCSVEKKIQLGPNLTKGLGAGSNPKIGEEAAIESKQEISAALEQGVKMVFIAAGMGGGTGTGAAPVVAQICKEMGILTVAVVTTPFEFEREQRMKCALAGIEELKQYVDSIIIVNNDKIKKHYGNLRISEGFTKVDEVVANAITAITNSIYSVGTINVDFNDVCTVMKNGGVAIMGVAKASGVNRAQEVTDAAINYPLLDDTDISGAKQILVNISTPKNENEITVEEIDLIQNLLKDLAGSGANLIYGLTHNEELVDEISLSLIITGFSNQKKDNTQLQVHTLKTEEPTPNHVAVSRNDKEQQNEKFNFNQTEYIKDEFPNIFLIEDEDATLQKINEDEIDMTKESEFFINSSATNDGVKKSREKSFEPYTLENNQLKNYKQIFYDKKNDEINFNYNKNEVEENNINTFKIQKNDQQKFSIEKNHEYTSIYNQKNVD